MNDHADLELIAAFREGLLDRAASEWVGRHLSGCASCAQHRSALDEVTVRLAEAPELPLPPVLARRLDAVLAAEVAAAGAAAAENAAERLSHGDRSRRDLGRLPRAAPTTSRAGAPCAT